MKKIPAFLTLLMIVALLVAAFVTIRNFAISPKPEYLQGQMEARRVMVAGKLPGRISSIVVHEGEDIAEGDIEAGADEEGGADDADDQIVEVVDSTLPHQQEP